MAATAVRRATSDRNADDAVRVVQWVVLLAPLVLIAYLAWDHRWIFDDGFINFRTIRQLEAGNGPVFNAGQRVESYTSALWIAVLFVGDVATPIRLEYVAVLAGISGTVLGVGLATLGAVRLARRTDPAAFLVPLGSVAIVTVAPIWYFATSGLEGGLTFAWLGATFFVAVRWALSKARTPRHTAVLVGLGWLIRPDLAILTVAVLAVLVVGDRREGRVVALRTVALAGALPLAYQVFRMGYFGQLLPNTAIAKEAGASHWGRGWDYLDAFVRDYDLWLLAIFAAGIYVLLMRRLRALPSRRPAALVTAFVVAGLAQGLYIVRVGGDYIPSRLLLPAFVTLVTPIAVVPVARWSSRVLVAGGLVWASLALAADRPGTITSAWALDRPGVVTLEAALQSQYGALVAAYQRPGVYFGGVRLDARPGPAATRHTVDESGIGIVGFAMDTDVRVLDWLGLVDPMTAHFALGRHGIAGHEKPIPGVWAAARLTAPGSHVPPDVVQPRSLFSPLIPRSTGATFDRQVATVRSVLRCRRVRDFVASYERPLTTGSFLSNIADSFSNTSLRIPADPTRARRELCR